MSHTEENSNKTNKQSHKNSIKIHSREHYKLFSKGQIANLTIQNRLIRSATWDPSILHSKRMTSEVLELYRKLSLGGVGMIITGGFPVFNEPIKKRETDNWIQSFSELRVEGLEQLAKEVHSSREDCKIIAQIENGRLTAQPSSIISPFSKRIPRTLTLEEIEDIIESYVEGIEGMNKAGFDGVQIHAAHGSLLSRFLSPYTNKREDNYGGSPSNRARIIREIVSRSRKLVGNFPILIKMNSTDYLVGGTDIHTFPELAKEIENIGIDALEISGGMWDCLVRNEQDLGFKPVPAPESHTQINNPKKQSYFLKFAEKLSLKIPIILVGGNRHVGLLEKIICQGRIDFIAMSRPLICEPDLPNRWLMGQGKPTTECISCNSCIFNMLVHPNSPEPELVTCVFKENKSLHIQAQKWLNSWVKENIQLNLD
ncbi:MAG TPA: NADH:flavin oxidoreductase [candidate division Zixibacteria bacterium]|nr:NADH:flavin oxidoreductase [candidate division Zixibacteria bacterium]